MSVVLFSNNPRLGTVGFVSPFDPDRLVRFEAGRYSCSIFEGPPLTVLLAGRTLVHAGYRLFHHPLYGNIRPDRQLYRTLILTGEAGRGSIHEWSLQLVEEAVALYRRVPALDQAAVPSAVLEDCAWLDYELIRGPLADAGWPGAITGP